MAVNSTPPVQLDPSQDQGHQIAFINQNFQSLANSLNPFILSDGTNNRLLIGKDSAGNYVVKVSKAGYDAFNAADANLIFNSGQDILKVVQTGTATLPGGSTASTNAQTSVAVAHNLGFTPAFLAFTVDPSFGTYTPIPYFAEIGTIQRNFASPNNGILLSTNQYITALADSTNITFYNTYANSVYPATRSVSAYSIKYYLLQETAT